MIWYVRMLWISEACQFAHQLAGVGYGGKIKFPWYDRSLMNVGDGGGDKNQLTEMLQAANVRDLLSSYWFEDFGVLASMLIYSWFMLVCDWHCVQLIQWIPSGFRPISLASPMCRSCAAFQIGLEYAACFEDCRGFASDIMLFKCLWLFCLWRLKLFLKIFKDILAANIRQWIILIRAFGSVFRGFSAVS